jgi:hypothetical protein
MLKRILTAGCGLLIASAVLALDNGERQYVRSVDTQHVEFPAGGTLRLEKSKGIVTVEGWDKTGVEITAIKSSHVPLPPNDQNGAKRDEDEAHITSERKDDELVITTQSKKFSGADIEYRIKAPRSAKVIIHNRDGQVFVDGMANDIDVTSHQGDIVLHLPQDAAYNINAKSRWGAVNSDYTGEEKRRWWLIGHRVANGNSPAPHKLNLSIGYGDIVILKSRVPAPPDSRT